MAATTCGDLMARWHVDPHQDACLAFSVRLKVGNMSPSNAEGLLPAGGPLPDTASLRLPHSFHCTT